MAAARPRFSWRRAGGGALLLALAGYGIICGYLVLNQNRLEYPRVATQVALAADVAARRAEKAGLVPWDRPVPGAPAPQGYVRPDFAAAPAPRGTIVVFHGNGNWAAQRTAFAEAFARRGFRTFLYEYPGYGGRPGTPWEKVIVPEARALIRSLDAAGYGPIYVWGESLGSGVAASVCADPALPVRGLVLLTAWDTVANVGYYRYPYIPVAWLMVDRYDSIANLARFGHPVCVVRCSEDEVIPPALTLNLFQHLPDPKKLILQEGYGHDNWPEEPSLGWWDEALDFTAPRAAAPAGAPAQAKAGP